MPNYTGSDGFLSIDLQRKVHGGQLCSVVGAQWSVVVQEGLALVKTKMDQSIHNALSTEHGSLTAYCDRSISLMSVRTATPVGPFDW